MRQLPADAVPWLSGHSAFTTVRLLEGQPLGWTQHAARLKVATRYLGLPPAEDFDVDVSSHAPRGWSLARITVDERATWFSLRPLTLAARPAGGVSVALTSHLVHPQLGRFKTGAHTPYTLAAREAQSQGCFEGWLTDVDGVIVDGARTGLVLEIDGELVVPDGGLASLTRARWMLESPNLPWAVRRPTLADLRRARSAWICGAGVGVVPVSMVKLPSGGQLDLDPRWLAPEHPQLVWPRQ